ncbi:MAG: ImmA/IrrE family metallo-endopeptidase, partial [Lentilitoribacter sp.]
MNQGKSNFPKKHANRLTSLWQEVGPNEYPLDIEILIDQLFSGDDFDSRLSVAFEKFDSIEGCLRRVQDTNQWLIAINSNIKNSRRLRFTLAHELGHFMCHRKLKNDFEDDLDTLSNYNSHLEYEANVFASHLLMPANIIRSKFSDLRWDVENLKNLGNYFECSLQASAIRYIELSNKPIAFVVSRDGMICWACKSSNAPYMTSYRFGDEMPK